MKRRLLAAVVVCACLAAACVLAVSLLTWESRIDPNHFEAIEVGMTKAEVEQLLGGPPRNECSGPVDVWVRREGGLQSAGLDPGTLTIQFFPAADVGEEAVWLSEAGLIAVRFGEDGRVQEKHVSNVVVIESPRRNLRVAILRWIRR